MKKVETFLSIGVLLFAAACSKSPQNNNVNTSHTTSVDSSIAKGSIYTMDMTFENQYGQKVQWQSLKGKVQVMAMIFSHCLEACPTITQDIKAAQQLIPESNKNAVGYTLISFDTKRDSSARLKEFSSEMRLDSAWQLLHGQDEDVQTIANLFNVKYKPLPNGAFSHENVILVIDQNGQIVFRREGMGKDPREIADKVKSLL